MAIVFDVVYDYTPFCLDAAPDRCLATAIPTGIADFLPLSSLLTAAALPSLSFAAADVTDAEEALSDFFDRSIPEIKNNNIKSTPHTGCFDCANNLLLFLLICNSCFVIHFSSSTTQNIDPNDASQTNHMVWIM